MQATRISATMAKGTRSSRIVLRPPISTSTSNSRFNLAIEHRLLLPSNPQNHGHMAPSLRRKYLVCFYCNKKSDIKYDGKITRWDCAQCESTNFLDENGDITDPPVATEYAAPSNLKYTIPRPDPSSQAFEPNLFCPTCLKNQHLYTSSLAQYQVETDTNHPRYKELERAYFAYRKELEKRYPQVCEDCLPQALERLRESGRTAKADHLRRLMDRSRARRLTAANGFYFSGSLDNAGGILWHLGLTGQLLWNIMALIVISQNAVPNFSKWPWVNAAMTSLAPIISISNSDAWARWSLFFSMAALWWNPMFKQMNSGFVNHIKGFRDWYKLQFLIIVTRSLFYYSMGTGIFANPLSSATTGAHIFVGAFVLLLSLKSRHSLKLDASPLWGNPSGELLQAGPKSNGATSGLASMTDVLEQIVATPSKSPQQAPPQSRPTYDLYPTSGNARDSKLPPVRSISPNTVVMGRKTSPSLLDMSESESVHYMATGELPARLQNEYSQSDDLEEMEWTPSQAPVSQHRAFNTPRILQQKPQLFGETPARDQPSPFWFKVPPAPVTPAQKLRNPPNQPRLRVSSTGTKENFFNKVTQRNSGIDARQQATGTVQNVEFAQQKFFPPLPPSEEGNTLADLLTSFSLNNSDTDSPKIAENHSSTLRHAFQAIVLVTGLLLWHYSHRILSEHSKNASLTVMICCACISAQTVYDYAIHIGENKQGQVWLYLGASLGGLGCAAAGYGILEIMSGRGGCEMFSSTGTVLVGGMLIQEIWLVFFGR